jgi:hypothetical protein
MANSLVLNSAVPTQKIRPDLLGTQRLPMADAANHQTMIGTDVQSLVHDGGSSVAVVTVVNGMEPNSNIVFSSNIISNKCTMDLSNSVHEIYKGNICDSGITRKLKDNVMDVSRVHANQIPVSCLQGSIGVASSPQTNGKVFDAISPQSSNNPCSLSVIESDNLSHYPSTEEVIAFGGIPKPTLGVRSSTRLGG